MLFFPYCCAQFTAILDGGERLSSIQAGMNSPLTPTTRDLLKPIELSEDRELVLIFAKIFERGRVIDGSAIDRCEKCVFFKSKCSGLIPIEGDLDVGYITYLVRLYNSLHT